MKHPTPGSRLYLYLCLLLSACSQVRQLSPADSFPDDDKLNYLVLSAIAPSAAKRYASAGSAQSRADYLDWFWKNPPSLTGSPPSSLLPSPSSFYRQRALQARTYFGATDLLNDDRVPTYIRYGPARREQYEAKVVETETTRTFVNPAEIWSYDSLGRQLDFVRTGTAFKLVGESRYGPEATMPALEKADVSRNVPDFTHDAKPLGLEMSLGRLGQSADTVEVELAFGVPLRTIAAVFPSDTEPLIHMAIDVTPQGKGAPVEGHDRYDLGREMRLNPPGISDRVPTPLHKSYWVSCAPPLDTTVVDFAVGREVFELPANVYTFTVTAVSGDGQTASRRVQNLNLIDYARSNQPVSDVLFYSLIDSTTQSPQFSRPDWARTVPLVVPHVRSGQSFYVLYEIYHLDQDSAGNHDAEVSYELIQRQTNEKAVLPSPRHHVTGTGPTGVAVERVHTMDLKPGPYLLVSRVRDMADTSDASDHASVTAQFDILPRR